MTVATGHPSAPLEGRWERNAAGRVEVVLCDCGRPLYYASKLHCRIADPTAGVAMCRYCKRWVRAPVGFVDH
ncbi:MAG TPA: hypothetical protein PK018_05395 [Candidatus Competibacter sp.]|jgi:hypothetical protein|nr:hypothetical protein [Gammaproteobacteria bacterium]HPE71599.1 hypothetical protein [Candidatus Competibacter sp.]HRW66208.1 hypothetical protein [Candidatus Competibacter sp.]